MGTNDDEVMIRSAVKGIRPFCSRAAQVRALCTGATEQQQQQLTVDGRTFKRDDWSNATPTILSKVGQNLHLRRSHPLGILRELIEAHFSSFEHLNALSPLVTVKQNFDDLEFPADHPGRSKTDTYYLNAAHVLRTHTSAHEVELLASENKEMERLLQDSNIVISDPTREETSTNSYQLVHDKVHARVIADHLKNSLNTMVLSLFARGGVVSRNTDPLQVRWVEAYFPWTQPSFEMEVLYRGEWLELLGSGVMSQDTLRRSGVGHKMGWAFGLGLERIAMVLFGIPDIRLFWSQDPRFLSQFTPGTISTFEPYSRYPPCYKDFSFWLGDGKESFHENDFCEVLRDIAGDLVEGVSLVDNFEHPKTKDRSLCYRINYRSMDRSLENAEVNALHDKVVE